MLLIFIIYTFYFSPVHSIEIQFDNIIGIGNFTIHEYVNFNNEYILFVDSINEYIIDKLLIIYYDEKTNKINKKVINDVFFNYYKHSENFIYFYFYNSSKYFWCEKTCLNIKTSNHFDTIYYISVNDAGSVVFESQDHVYTRLLSGEWNKIDAFYNFIWSPYNDNSFYYKDMLNNLFEYSIETNSFYTVATNVVRFFVFNKKLFILSKNKHYYVYNDRKFQKLIFPPLLNIKDMVVYAADVYGYLVLIKTDEKAYIFRSNDDLHFIRLVTLSNYEKFDKKKCFHALIHSKIPGLILANLDKDGYTKISLNFGFSWDSVMLIDDNGNISVKSVRLLIGCVFYSPTKIDYNPNFPWLLLSLGIDDNKIYCLYISLDYGSSWKCILKKRVRFFISDTGLEIYAYFDNKISVSVNYGETWKTYGSDHFKESIIEELNSLMFSNYKREILFFQTLDKNYNYQYYYIDTSNSKLASCKANDLEDSYPQLRKVNNNISDNNTLCIRGNSFILKRRKITSNCFFNRSETISITRFEACPCNKNDYGCIYGYYKVNENCIKDPLFGRSELLYCSSNNFIQSKTGYYLLEETGCSITNHEIFQLNNTCQNHTPLYFLVYNENKINLVHYIRNPFMEKSFYYLRNIMESDYSDKNKWPVVASIDFMSHCLYYSDKHSIFSKCPYYINSSSKNLLINIENIKDMNFDYYSSNLIILADKQIIFFSRTGYHKVVYVHPNEIKSFKIYFGFLLFLSNNKIYKLTFEDFRVNIFEEINDPVEDFDYNYGQLFYITKDTVVLIRNFEKKILFKHLGIHSVWYVNYMLIVSSDIQLIAFDLLTNEHHSVYIPSSRMDFEETKDLEVGIDICKNKCEYICSLNKAGGYRCVCPENHSFEDGNCKSNVDSLNCMGFQFKCKNGRCIDNSATCDHMNDCFDFSDEINCSETNSCHSNQFSCTDQSKCISLNQICNGINDCTDSSDEKNCDKGNCSIIEFKCSNGICIELSQICNGNNDCGDNSDEISCTLKINCKINQFMCDQKCFSNELICDGKKDCLSGEDEKDCHIDPNPNVDPIENCRTIFCDGKCLEYNFICDNIQHCSNGLDEMLCLNLDCEHSCKIKCIRNEDICDGYDDCFDKSDENCPSSYYNIPRINTCKLPYSVFCKTMNRCIPINLVCNGKISCPSLDFNSSCQTQSNLFKSITFSADKLSLVFNPKMQRDQAYICLYNIDEDINSCIPASKDKMTIDLKDLTQYIVVVKRDDAYLFSTWIKTPSLKLLKPSLTAYTSSNITWNVNVKKIVPFFKLLISEGANDNVVVTTKKIFNVTSNKQINLIKIFSCYNYDFNVICSEPLIVNLTDLFPEHNLLTIIKNEEKGSKTSLIAGVVSCLIIFVFLTIIGLTLLIKRRNKILAEGPSYSRLLNKYDKDNILEDNESTLLVV